VPKQNQIAEAPQQPSRSAARVPAFYAEPPSASNLAPTLPPEKFTSDARQVYKAVKEIPQTIAQLPCYCHCDLSIGHKSLHSCFEDNHAATCFICMEEAMTAYRLQKEQNLTPAQIRDRIIAHYSAH
jgi:hypothetical protein